MVGGLSGGGPEIDIGNGHREKPFCGSRGVEKAWNNPNPSRYRRFVSEKSSAGDTPAPPKFSVASSGWLIKQPSGQRSSPSACRPSGCRPRVLRVGEPIDSWRFQIPEYQTEFCVSRNPRPSQCCVTRVGIIMTPIAVWRVGPIPLLAMAYGHHK